MDKVSFKSAPAIGTNAADVVYAYNTSGHKVRIDGLSLLPDVTVALDASNYITTTVVAPDGSTTLSTHTTESAGSALAAGTEEELTLGAAAIGEAIEVENGEAVKFSIAKTGTGPAYDFVGVVRATVVRP